MRNYIERAKTFCNQFDSYCGDCIYEEEYEAAVRVFNREHNRKVSLCHGATRWVFVTSDYAVKVDRCDGECIQENLVVFGGCEQEMDVYHQAQEDGFAYLFAPITRYMVGNHVYYIMPRVSGIGSSEGKWYNLTYDEQDYLLDHVGDMHDYNVGVFHGQYVVIDYACPAF